MEAESQELKRRKIHVEEDSKIVSSELDSISQNIKEGPESPNGSSIEAKQHGTTELKSEPAAETEKATKAVSESGEWIPKSISSIADMYSFDSSTYHSPIPTSIAKNPKEPVVLGVDEAGRGPVLGPMVYGISYCLKEYQQHLKKKYGFADSKTLKDSTRQDLFKLIDQENHDLYDNVGWATCTMTAKDISNGMLRSVLGAGSYNLNEQAHDTTIQLIKDTIARGVNVREVFVDTVGPPVTYQAKLQKIFPDVDITVAKKADSIYPIVSTASVVAKVTRDLNLQWYNQNHETLRGHRIGSGYPSDPNTSKWLTGNVDKVFGWSHGLVRFLWQTAKDALERNKGVKVIYEDECVNDGGYGDIGDMFGKKSKFVVDALFYGREADIWGDNSYCMIGESRLESNVDYVN